MIKLKENLATSSQHEHFIVQKNFYLEHTDNNAKSTKTHIEKIC